MKLLDILLKEAKRTLRDIESIEITYTTRSDFYAVYFNYRDGGRDKKWVGEFNTFLGKLGISEELPMRSIPENQSRLNKIIEELQAKGVEARWDESMDVS